MLEAGRFRARILGEARELCCAGCEAVASAIVSGGFERYYEARTSCPATAAKPDLRPIRDDFRGSDASLILDRVTCGACLWLIEQVLRRVPGVERADVNYATQRAQLSWDPAKTDLASIQAAVRAVGYDAWPYEPRKQEEIARRERRAELWRLFIAGFGAMQVMMYAYPAYFGAGDLSPEAESLMRWASLVITIPVLAIACRPFFTGARRELANARIGLDTPIALGLAGGFAASVWATLTGSGEVYFDSISMLALLLLAARFAEAAGRRKAGRALDPLLSWVSERKVSAGEMISVAPGERVPADGIVEAGVSSADESLLTGESHAVAKRPGDALVGGSVNLEQPLTLRVTRAGADTQAAAIARLAERAAAAKPRLVEAADRVARWLTPLVIVTAAAAGLYWGDVWVAVAVLVVTCPCALGLAAPVVLARAHAKLLSRGALLTRSSALQALERVSDVVLDKTGTLTLGQVAVREIHPLGRLGRDHCLELARSLEAASRHPIARAFAGGEVMPLEDVRHVMGEGIEGRIDGKRTRIGSRKFCEALAGSFASEGNVFLVNEEGPLAAFELADALRPEAGALVAALKARGIGVHLASGDQPAIVGALARELGIVRWRGAMTPWDKHDYVAGLQRQGRTVAMIGDGLNDAPVLARADVSFAMGAGADAAQLQADVVLLGNDLRNVPETFALARRSMHLVRQNLAWALAYNAAALPLAAAGWIGPWEAALFMGASSLAVLANASRTLAVSKAWKASISSFPSRSPSYS